MIAAPVQCDVDGIPKGSHYVSVSTIKVRLRSFLINGHGRPVVPDVHGPDRPAVDAIVDRRSLPLAVHVACASPHEVRLVDATLEDRFIAPYPPRLIGDRAYDSDR